MDCENYEKTSGKCLLTGEICPIESASAKALKLSGDACAVKEIHRIAAGIKPSHRSMAIGRFKKLIPRFA